MRYLESKYWAAERLQIAFNHPLVPLIWFTVDASAFKASLDLKKQNS